MAWFLGLATLAAGGLGGCSRDGGPGKAEVASTRPAAEGPVEHRVVGVVKASDTEAGEVIIAHEEIPGFMRAMTMSFEVADPALLDDVRPGDEVEGRLRVAPDGSKLTVLEVTRPALGGPLTIGLSGEAGGIGAAPTALEPGQLVPDFAMTTQAGEPLRLSDLRGNVVALTFIYTRCPLPEACPLLDRKFGELAARLGAVADRASRVRLLSVSFDPEHDTPEVLSEHARTRGASPPLWTFAAADHAALAGVAGPLGLTYGPGGSEIVHTLTIAVIGPDGRLVRLETGGDARRWEVSEIYRTVASAIPDRSAPAP